jgi:hypothetical protein
MCPRPCPCASNGQDAGQIGWSGWPKNRVFPIASGRPKGYLSRQCRDTEELEPAK